jgi:dCTP deaminase
VVLTGKQIIQEIEVGNIEIEPFNREQINPNSYDVLLDDVSVYDLEEYGAFDTRKPPRLVRQPWHKDKNGQEYMILIPDVLYIASTVERTYNPMHVIQIADKSSIARAGVSTHFNAGFGDCGFNGKWTLEIKSTFNTKVYRDQKIAQLVFLTVQGEIDEYNGKYQNQNGAVGSRGHIRD